MNIKQFLKRTLWIWIIVAIYSFVFFAFALPKIELMLEHRVIEVSKIPTMEKLQDDYNSMETFLKEKNWEKADEVSLDIIYQTSINNDLNQLSCPNLEKVDRLWQKYSNNQYGFEVQKSIYEQLFNQVVRSNRNIFSYAIPLPWLSESDTDQYRQLEPIYKNVYRFFISNVGWDLSPIQKIKSFIQKFKNQKSEYFSLLELIEIRNNIYKFLLEFVQTFPDQTHKENILEMLEKLEIDRTEKSQYLSILFQNRLFLAHKYPEKLKDKMIEKTKIAFKKQSMIIESEFYNEVFAKIDEKVKISIDEDKIIDFRETIDNINDLILLRINDLSLDNIEQLVLPPEYPYYSFLSDWSRYPAINIKVNTPINKTISSSKNGLYPARVHFVYSDKKYTTDFYKSLSIFTRLKTCSTPTNILEFLTTRQDK